MSNHLQCPACGVETSDSMWPCVGWGNFVSDHQVDGTSGTEDPAVVVQSGTKTYACPCRSAAWISGVGWLISPDLTPEKKHTLAELSTAPRRMIQLREAVARATGADHEDFVVSVHDETLLGRPIRVALIVTLGSARATLGLRPRSGGSGCDLRAEQAGRGVRVECLSCAVEVGPEEASAEDRITRHLAEVSRSTSGCRTEADPDRHDPTR